MKLKFRHVNRDNISLMTEDGSICQLDRADYLKNQVPAEIGDSHLFWFVRLKSKTEGKGNGSFLMRELVKILDENKLWVLNSINPYGSMNLEQLIKFYQKYGFTLLDKEGGMYRRPTDPT